LFSIESLIFDCFLLYNRLVSLLKEVSLPQGNAPIRMGFLKPTAGVEWFFAILFLISFDRRILKVLLFEFLLLAGRQPLPDLLLLTYLPPTSPGPFLH